MRETSRDFEIIEVLPTDDPALTWSSAAQLPGPRRPPGVFGRRPLLAAAGAAGLIVAAVVAFSGGGPGSGNGTTAPPTTAPTTRPASDPAQLGTRDALYQIDATAGLVPYVADVHTPVDRSGVFELWSSGSAAGPWVSVQASPRTDAPYAFVDATRRVSNGLDLVSPDADASSTSIVIEREGLTLTITAHAIPDEQLVQFATGLRMTGRSAYDSSGVLAALDLELIASRPRADVLLYGEVETSTRYLTDDGDLITLTVAEGSEPDRIAMLPYFTRDASYPERGNRATAILSDTGDSVVLWDSDGRSFSLTGPIPPAQLVDISLYVRSATTAEWTALVYGLHPDYRIERYETTASGLDADGTTWRAGIQLAERSGRTSYLWWWNRPDRPGAPASTAVVGDPSVAAIVDTVVVRGATFVFVAVPATVAGDEATVVAGDGTTITIPLREVFPDEAVKAGATRIDTPGPLVVTPPN